MISLMWEECSHSLISMSPEMMVIAIYSIRGRFHGEGVSVEVLNVDQKCNSSTNSAEEMRNNVLNKEFRQ